MTYPRSHLVDQEGYGTYHVCSRCVRRSFLCGVDFATGRDFSHRRDWIESRIFELCEIFSISVYAYAVMANHYHLVVSLEPMNWTDEDVVDRWLRLCPGRQSVNNVDTRSLRKSAILENPGRVKILRKRLRSLSWFMRFINEPLARFANKEDECTGRFWEGRFKSQILLDEASVLACMVYVDLNPIRAGIAQDLAGSGHTSIQYRLSQHKAVEDIAAIGFSATRKRFNAMSLSDYVLLILWTVAVQSGERPGIKHSAPDCIVDNYTTADRWFRDHVPKPNKWQRAMGSTNSIKDYARHIGQRWVQNR